MKDALTRLGGLWKNQSHAGSTYFSGRLGMARIYVFENLKKQDEKSPDYFLCLGPAESKEKKDASDYRHSQQTPSFTTSADTPW